MRRNVRNVLIGSAILALMVGLGIGQNLLERSAQAQTNGKTMAPRFEVDPMWPKPLPNHWILGMTIGVGIDSRDHVYIIHRGAATLDPKERYAMASPPASECCVAAPPILEFDSEGNLVKGWGGTVMAIPFVVDRSTTSLVERIRNG